MPTTQHADPNIDPARFRDEQRQTWNQFARGWRKWSSFIDRHTSVVSRRMIELADLKAGQTVLDVACGYGEPSLTAARAVGSDGHVVATDISSQQLAFGRERAKAAGLRNIEFVEAGASSLNLTPGKYDAALSRWGIIFEPELEKVVGRIKPALKSGGRMVVASWGTPDRVPMIGLPVKVLMETLEVPPPAAPGAPGPFARPTEQAIAGLLTAGGLQEVQAEELLLTMQYDSVDEYVEFCREIIPPLTEMLKEHPAEQQNRVWTAITQTVKKAFPDGRPTFVNQALIACGRA